LTEQAENAPAAGDTLITLYTSSGCAHAWAVERFMEDNEIAVELVNIDRDQEARQLVMAINNGYASVPTLVFPDGSTLTEPSFQALRAKLALDAAT
jgi:mycoredoxin